MNRNMALAAIVAAVASPAPLPFNANGGYAFAAGAVPGVNSDVGCNAAGQVWEYNGTAMACGSIPTGAGIINSGGTLSAQQRVFTTTGAVANNSTVEVNYAAIKIPANTMGKNGAAVVDCLWVYPNDSVTKQEFYRLTTSSGSVSGGLLNGATTQTTTQTSQQELVIRNNNSTGAQFTAAAPPTGPFGSNNSAVTSTSVDTTADAYININGSVSSAADTLTLDHCVVSVLPSSP